MDCPFLVEDIDYDAIGREICISCNLLKFLKLEKMDKAVFRYFDYDTWFEMDYLRPLAHCPLKDIDKLEISTDD